MLSTRLSGARSIHFSSRHRWRAPRRARRRYAAAVRSSPRTAGRNPAPGARGRQIDAELRQELRAGRRYFAGLVAEDDELALDQALGKPTPSTPAI
jgi:hypothetical protein